MGKFYRMEKPLFSPAWLASGIVSDESAADFARYASGNPAKSVRFWRWAAFRDFVEENGPLSAALCRAAYHLGSSEPDRNLGMAIVAHVLYERFCPKDVWAEAQVRDPELTHRIAFVRNRFSPTREGRA